MVLLVLILAAGAALAQPSMTDGPQFLKQHCAACHSGAGAQGGFNIARMERPEAWSKAALRVHNGEMPPRAPLPVETREAFAAWVRDRLRAEACSVKAPLAAPAVRRLSRTQ